MLHLLLTWDGVGYVIFMQDGILNIRMTTLYSWLTAADFNIDIKGLFGVQAGIPHVLLCSIFYGYLVWGYFVLIFLSFMF